ncbi:hypothetical protein DFH09DRAFT_1069800 [Mycena vulgaris]|nr:hypothetical protein DFH09DRAFT_1069800 [Mycena vulgaris]
MAPDGLSCQKDKNKDLLALTKIRRRKRGMTQLPVLFKFDPPSTPPALVPRKPSVEPLGDPAVELGWNKLTQEMEAALRLMGDTNLVCVFRSRYVPSSPRISSKAESEPEPTASSEPEEIEKDRACANMMRMCVAAMHPLELSYWRDEEAREVRLQKQQKIWQEEEERAQGLGLADEERSGYLDVYLKLQTVVVFWLWGERYNVLAFFWGGENEDIAKPGNVGMTTYTVKAWTRRGLDTLNFLGASLEVKAEAEWGISRGNDKLSLGTYVARRACSGGMDSSGLRKITQRFGLGTDDAL